MTEQNQSVSREMELALKAVEQAKARLQKAKSKEADRKRKEDTHNKIIWGGIVKKYFPDCAVLSEAEMNEVLSVAIASADCQRIIQKIKSQSAGYGTYQKPLQEEADDEE